MVGQHHQLNGHEIGQTLRDHEGQGGLACCSPWGHNGSNMTWQLNNITVWGIKNLPNEIFDIAQEGFFFFSGIISQCQLVYFNTIVGEE